MLTLTLVSGCLCAHLLEIKIILAELAYGSVLRVIGDKVQLPSTKAVQ